MKTGEKILLIGAVPPPIGGAAIWMKNYQEILLDKKIQFDFVDTSLIGKRAINVGSKWRLFTEIKRAKKIFQNTKKLIKSNTYSLVHFNINCSKSGTIRDYLVAKEIKKSGIRVFLHCHCNVSDQIGDSKISTLYLKKLFKLADKIFVLNKESKEYCNALGFDNSFIVPNFINSNQISTGHAINETIKKALFLGHVKKTKGIVEFLDCASKFKDITFLIAGQETDDIPLTKLLKQACFKNVKYLGNVDHENIFKLLDEADVFLFPSYTEGFSLSLLEAMARGVPIIATNVGANEEMLSGNCGYLIKAKDCYSLSEKLADYISDKQMRATHSFNAIKKARELYSSEAVITLMMQLYD